MNYISFLLFATAATLKAFMDTIVFRSGQSIFPERWSPFKTYSTVKLIAGYFRPDAYHISMYFFIFAIVGCIANNLKEALILGMIWGVCFEVPWRLFRKT